MGWTADFGKLARRSGSERRPAMEAFLLLGLLRAAILLLPFRCIVRLLRLRPGVGTARIETPATAERIGQVGWALTAAAARTPWQSTCLAKALCGQWMLARRGLSCTIYLGVAKGGQGGDLLHAHAWLRCGERIVCGERESESLIILAAFTR